MPRLHKTVLTTRTKQEFVKTDFQLLKHKPSQLLRIYIVVISI